MLTGLSLRMRIFLFFCLLAVGGAALAGLALLFGWSRGGQTLPAAPFVTSFVVFAFLNTGLALVVWLLFDEHVAKPINRLSADLRLRAHSGVNSPINTSKAVYLGDLAPAADALSQSMSQSLMQAAEQVAEGTQRLQAQSERLTALFTEIPIATILLNPEHEIVLYDGQAADILSRIAPPRLKASVSDYFDVTGLKEAVAALSDHKAEVAFTLRAGSLDRHYDARLKALGKDGYAIFIEPDDKQGTSLAPRPLVFDFDLISVKGKTEINDTALTELCYVVFDCETTGLSVETDDIVQIGAVRILNNRLVQGEVINTYVNPGRPIPAASTKIHKVTNENVADAPDIKQAGRALHRFATDAVLVAHNAPFDMGLLQRYGPEIGVDWNHPILDTVLISAVVFGTTEDHSLDALCKRLDIQILPQTRHTALGDANATGAVLTKLLPLLAGKGIRQFGQLVQECQKHGRLLHDLNEKHPG